MEHLIYDITHAYSYRLDTDDDPHTNERTNHDDHDSWLTLATATADRKEERATKVKRCSRGTLLMAHD